MKKLKIILSFLLLCFFLSGAYAQKITVKKGDLSVFKEFTEINAAYDFSDFGVGKFKTEQAYIAKKKADYNEDEPGKGDRWAEEWENDKENTYQRKFEELFNVVMISEETGILMGSYPSADYTLTLKTIFLEPGYNVGISRKDASINVLISIAKSDDLSNPLCVVQMDKCPGRGAMGGDYDTEYRIGEAYAKCGKELAQYVYKKVLK